jgi:YidC/Oxa1 family membrane protein insertase
MSAALVFNVLQPLEDAVRWLLERFHYDVGLSWAWSIVATTIVVRILLVPLTVRQIHSMQSLQKHAPEMKEIQRKYKGDRQKMNEEMMKFYRENHINPAASCLPMIAQLPVFISLYLVLKHFSRNITAGADLSWLHFVPDITAKADSRWSGFVLLAVYALSQASSTYFMSATMDKMQRRLMMVLPLVFITVIAHFQVGLVLYWVTTNLWTVGQGLVTRRLVPKTPPVGAGGPKRTSRTPPAGGDSGNGAKTEPTPPKRQPPAQTQPRRVKRKKGGARR